MMGRWSVLKLRLVVVPLAPSGCAFKERVPDSDLKRPWTILSLLGDDDVKS